MKIKKFFKRKFQRIPFQEERGVAILGVALGWWIIMAVSALIGASGVAAIGGIPGFDEMFSGVFLGVANVVNMIAAGFLEFCAAFFRVAVDIGGTIDPRELAGTSSFQNVSQIFEDLGYMIVALGFVICGIATALRIQEYEAKKTLVPLILAAVLISVSYGLFFEIWAVSNEITGLFIHPGGTGDYNPISINPVRAGANAWHGLVGLDTMTSIMKGGACIFMNFFTGSVYLLYALIFLIRWAAIPILIIVSPLALACIPIGFLKHIWNKWLNQFTGWCLFGIIGGLCIYMSNVFMANPPQSVLDALSLDPVLAPFKYIMPLGALLFGLFFAGAGSLVGASAISSGIAAAGAGVMGVAAGGMAKIAGGVGAVGGAAKRRGAPPRAVPGGAPGAGAQPTIPGPTGTPPAAPGAVPGGGVVTPTTPGAGLKAGGIEAIKQIGEVGTSVAKDVIGNVGGAIKGAIEKATDVAELK